MTSAGTQRHLAFYLPQFHPIPENDEWWGAGFTEWVNVAKARPLFRGHRQPHIPGELGFYDLRLAETRAAQAALAQAHGIDGFVYYHYWFSGTRLLNRPFDDVRTSGEPNFPFALCWANESWTRAWDGRSRHVLMEQRYDDDRAHARWLSEAFADPRYIRVDGKPLFIVYRASQLPDARRTTNVLREEAERAGVGELYLARVESFTDERSDPRALGFDASVEFAPDWKVLEGGLSGRVRSGMRRLGGTGSRRPWQLHDYASVADRMQSKRAPAHTRFPCVTPRWDNTARKGRHGLALVGDTPERYGEWVEWASRTAPTTPGGESLVFVNAWNEWAEGAHLEPDRERGNAFLKAHRNARLSSPGDDHDSP
ncbi:glycoside hydrolase family 99-like domain-containing protein [Nostocoides sp. Soil756]|jgi:lipopolysaccharide biosynthesis protein|uniref:glycosyltransferase WbsX family protein n=1 Tax=Nostocoides sp. Soil756 TaxID=1736399 RepID=UPI0006F3F59D|nr:glycoside hydrolase family 99-like domain-containing protein [Tetrasphaera sp. Soil756]KRE62286.1 glycosyl hydrolase [Tetrasphaera sp. Soil756]